MTTYGNLCAVERDALCALSSGETMTGQEVKDLVGEQRSIAHGNLYPALDRLDGKGLIIKRRAYFDGRTNGYTISQAGANTLSRRRGWEQKQADE